MYLVSDERVSRFGGSIFCLCFLNFLLCRFVGFEFSVGLFLVISMRLFGFFVEFCYFRFVSYCEGVIFFNSN